MKISHLVFVGFCAIWLSWLAPVFIHNGNGNIYAELGVITALLIFPSIGYLIYLQLEKSIKGKKSGFKKTKTKSN